MTDNNTRNEALVLADSTLENLPDHLLIEIFIRIPVSEWVQLSCVKRRWANLFCGEYLWQAALEKKYPFSSQAKRWPGPIPRGLSKRRYTALYVSEHFFSLDGEIDEIVGHTYLFLKEQLVFSRAPPSSAILHGTIIGLYGILSTGNLCLLYINNTFGESLATGCPEDHLTLWFSDQFIACGKSRDAAHELASQIWLAVLDNMEENDHTFLVLKSLAQEEDVFLPYPYTKSIKVQWRVFEKLFTDFRDCFDRADYYDILASAKNKFQPIPSTWLGY